MLTAEARRSLELIAQRSPEGVGVPVATLEEASIPAAVVRDLVVEGLLEFVGGDEDTVCVTAEGRRALSPST
jgi:hypothetical protein